MDGRSIWRVVFGVVLALLVVGIGVGVYNAGMAQGMAQVGQVAAGQPAVNPAAGPYPYYGWGWGLHPWGFGFGFLHLLFPLFFFLLIFGLLRAAWGGRRWGGYPGGWGDRRVPPMFEDWHRRAHEEPKPPGEGQATT